MCMNCGCDEPNERHKPGDITRADMEKAAKNWDITLEKAASNIHASAKKLRESSKSKQK
jgi:hypothetical protein